MRTARGSEGLGSSPRARGVKQEATTRENSPVQQVLVMRSGPVGSVHASRAGPPQSGELAILIVCDDTGAVKRTLPHRYEFNARGERSESQAGNSPFLLSEPPPSGKMCNDGTANRQSASQILARGAHPLRTNGGDRLSTVVRV